MIVTVWPCLVSQKARLGPAISPPLMRISNGIATLLFWRASPMMPGEGSAEGGLGGLVDGVAGAEVLDLGVAVFVGDRVVEADNVEIFGDLVDGELVVRAADAHRSAGAVDDQCVVGAAH